jgi:C4-dicarboxylate-specific signal transduction histidine kinase
MNATKLIGAPMLMVSALLMAAACSNRDAAAERQADIANTRSQGEQKVAEAQADAAKTEAKAEEKVDETVADTNHKVALEKCGSLSGAAEEACKKQADADYFAAKAHAEQQQAAAAGAKP